MSKPSVRIAAILLAVLSSASVAGAQTPLVDPTRDFVQAAAQSDQFEIVEAQTALAQTRSLGVRAFAEEMIGAHTGMRRSLQDAAVGAGLPPPPMSLGGDQQKLLAALQSQGGPAFDRTYLKQQAIAHQEALDAEQAYAAAGADARVRQAARADVPIIQRHLDQVRRLQASLGVD